ELVRFRIAPHQPGALHQQPFSCAVIDWKDDESGESGMTTYNEMHSEGAAEPRAHYHQFGAWLSAQGAEALEAKRTEADLVFRRIGITFAVYGDEQGTERLIPFDIVPRIIPSAEWRLLEAGLRQRVQALNLFLHDI